MKKNFDLSLFLGCCVIAIGIVLAGWLISKELPETTKVPANLAVTTTNVESGYEFGNYLSKHEVSAYLGITSEDVNTLIQSGQLDGISTQLGANLVFSKEGLDKWMEGRFDFPE